MNQMLFCLSLITFTDEQPNVKKLYITLSEYRKAYSLNKMRWGHVYCYRAAIEVKYKLRISLHQFLSKYSFVELFTYKLVVAMYTVNGVIGQWEIFCEIDVISVPWNVTKGFTQPNKNVYNSDWTADWLVAVF